MFVAQLTHYLLRRPTHWLSTLAIPLLFFVADSHAPKLRLLRLKGSHRDKHAVSLIYSYRIVLYLRLEFAEIILLDVGSHDEVYRG